MARMHRICRTMKNDSDYSSTFLVYCVTAGADVYSKVFDTDFTASLLSRFSLHSLATASVSCFCTLSFPLLHPGKTYKKRQTQSIRAQSFKHLRKASHHSQWHKCHKHIDNPLLSCWIVTYLHWKVMFFSFVNDMCIYNIGSTNGITHETYR